VLPLDLRHRFPDEEVHTAQWAGFKGLKNGELLRAAEDAGYEVLLTADNGIGHQQQLSGRNIAIIAVRGETNRLEDLERFVDSIRNALRAIQPGTLIELQ
jgi:hypothetical protein